MDSPTTMIDYNKGSSRFNIVLYYKSSIFFLTGLNLSTMSRTYPFENEMFIKFFFISFDGETPTSIYVKGNLVLLFVLTIRDR